MSLQDAKAYAKHCRDEWFDLLHLEGEGRREICDDFYFYLIIVKSCLVVYLDIYGNHYLK